MQSARAPRADIDSPLCKRHPLPTADPDAAAAPQHLLDPTRCLPEWSIAYGAQKVVLGEGSYGEVVGAVLTRDLVIPGPACILSSAGAPVAVKAAKTKVRTR